MHKIIYHRFEYGFHIRFMSKNLFLLKIIWLFMCINTNSIYFFFHFLALCLSLALALTFGINLRSRRAKRQKLYSTLYFENFVNSPGPTSSGIWIHIMWVCRFCSIITIVSRLYCYSSCFEFHVHVVGGEKVGVVVAIVGVVFPFFLSC